MSRMGDFFWRVYRSVFIYLTRTFRVIAADLLSAINMIALSGKSAISCQVLKLKIF
jgi:hypothetical protein